MADSQISDKRFYVYALLREDGTTPFYIGKGEGERWSWHEWNMRKDKTKKGAFIRQLRAKNIKIKKIKLHEDLTEDQALMLEIRLIRIIGRIPNGPLLNETGGGEGVSGLSGEALARRNAAIRNAYSDPALRERQGNASRERQKDPALKEMTRERLKAALNANPQMLSDRAYKAWANYPSKRQAIAAANKRPESRAKKSAGLREAWKDPIKRAAFMRCVSPEAKAKRRKSWHRYCATEEGKKMLSEAGKKGSAAKWAKHPKNPKQLSLPLLAPDQD